MGTSMKCEKRSLALLSSKRTKAYTRSKADEAFALPSFSDQAIPYIRETKIEHVYASVPNDAIPVPDVAASCEHNGHDVEHDGRNAKQHRHDLEPDGHDVKCHVNNNEPDVDNDGCDVDIDGHMDTDGRDAVYKRYGVKHNGLHVLMDGCDVKHNGYDVQHNRHDMEHDGHDVRHQGHDVGHDGHYDAAFDDGHDVEQLKQTMLKHESIFKEQLCELHRLYQVQRSLMAEMDRQEGSSPNPHIDPSSSNGSLLSNQTLFKEKNLFNANHNAEAKLNIKEKPSFFSNNLDINTVFDDVENTEMPSLAMNKALNRRILLDLERPAEEYVDEVEKEKCQNFPVSHKRKMSESKGLWNFHGGKEDNMAKEVSYTAKEVGFQGSHILSSQVSPPSRGIYSGSPTIADKLNGPQLFGCELAHNSQGTSNLPHWLLQASPEVKNTPPSHSVSLASSGQQQKLSFFKHKHEDVNHQFRNIHLHFGERTKSVGTENIPQHCLSNGQGLQEQHFSREPLNIMSGFVASTMDKISSSSHSMDEKHVTTPSTQQFVNTHTTAHDTRVSQNVILNQRELESGSKLPPWLQNFSTGQQALKPSNRIQQLPCISSLNQWSSIQTSPSQQAYNQLQQANNPLLQATSLSTTSEHAMEGLEVSWTELLSKRSNISPMKSSSPALADNNIVGVKRGLTPIMTSNLQTSENVGLFQKGPQNHDRTNPTKASFDLNVTVNEFPNEKGMETNKGWFAKLGIKAGCQERPKVMQGSLYIEGTSFLNCSGKDLPKNVVENVECIDIGSDAGGHCEGGKSSDGSGLTSVESLEAMHLIKVIEDSNASSGDQSGDSSRNSNIIQQLDDGMGMLCGEACIMTRNKHQTIGSSVTFAFPLDLNEECVVVDDHCHHFGNIHEAPSKLDTEAAHVLLWLGSDLPSLVTEDSSLFKKDEERSLKWLADIIPEEESVEMTTSMDVDGNRHSELSLFEGSDQGSGLDSFELLVLSTKPIDPEDIELSTPPIESGAIDPIEEPSPPPVSNPRRRSSRRGKANKDFKREILPSVACLSRHEVTEDLQIIEGLIQSARETTGACDSSPKEEGKCFMMPDAGPTKNNIVKARGGGGGGSKSSRGLKPNPKALLRVCSWGESTRRKRMSRQRSQWSCLPPNVL